MRRQGSGAARPFQPALRNVNAVDRSRLPGRRGWFLHRHAHEQHGREGNLSVHAGPQLSGWRRDRVQSSMRTRARFVLLFLIAACPAAAQTVPSNAQTPEGAAMVALRNDVEAVAAQIIMARAADRTDVDGRLNLNRYGNLLGSALVRARGIQLQGYLSNLMLAAEQSRTDEQIGSGSGASGTTSLASKGSVPAILGLAVENGALTQTTSGTTITFTGNPVGIVQALEDKGFVATAGASDPVLEKLSRVSFSVAFDAGRGVTTPTFTGDRQQLSQYSFRAELLNHRDPRRSALWRSIPSLTTLASEQGTWIRAAQASAAFKAWFDPLQSAVDT